MRHWYKVAAIGFLLLLTLTSLTTQGQAADPTPTPPIVRAVFFYSTSCGHCAKVINEDLPPLIEQYGDQLQLMGVNTSTREGYDLFLAFLQEWKIDQSRYGVPALVVGDTHLVGSLEIPQEFPKIIEKGLQEGGIDWPGIPGLAEIIVQLEGNPGGTSTNSSNPGGRAQTSVGHDITVWDRFQMDLAGNILAVVTLAGMIISVVWILILVLRASPTTGKDWSWVIPLLSIIGLVVAGYLSFVEVTETEAVCGPIGDCNSVQQSPYAKLFGFLPVGILGLVGYVAILLAWVLKKYGPASWRDRFSLAMWAMAFFGVVFSIYLTYLEPFVIGATCAWCVSSAIIITLQFWAATEPVRRIWVYQEDDDILESEIETEELT